MKVTCILTSFNRPNWVRHSLGSVFCQTHQDYELIVIDESEIFDIRPVVAKLPFREVKVVHHDVSAEERAKVNRLSVNINEGLNLATGDLVCYLADDDFLYPEWFSEASSFFSKNPGVFAAFGKLARSYSREWIYPTDPEIVFPNGIISDPFCRLDHNQIVHRKLQPPIEWPIDKSTLSAPDGLFMREVGKRYPFHPIPVFAAVKRMEHGKNLQNDADIYMGGHMRGARE
mgnify:CR=1 FL=1